MNETFIFLFSRNYYDEKQLGNIHVNITGMSIKLVNVMLCYGLKLVCPSPEYQGWTRLSVTKILGYLMQCSSLD